MSDEEGVIARLPDGRIQISVEAIPLVARKLTCALPLLLRASSAPDFPGMVGGCFLVRARGRLLALTAWHNVRALEGPGTILVPAGWKRSGFIEWVDLYGPASDRPDDLADVAVLLAAENTVLGGDVEPLDAEPFMIANLDEVEGDGNTLLAVRGHPTAAGSIHYDEFTISTGVMIAPGFYRGPADPHLHRMAVDTSRFATRGFSGSPVLMCNRVEGVGWQAVLAGMVLRGGPHLLHFLEATMLTSHLRRAAQTFRL
jgi:hypothetical protein